MVPNDAEPRNQSDCDKWRFVKWAGSVQGLTKSEAKVLCHLAGKLWAGNSISPRGWHPGVGSMTIATIAAACDVSTRTVRRALKVFEKRGLLTREHRYWRGEDRVSRESGRQLANAYIFPDCVIAAAAALRRSRHDPVTTG